MPDQFYLEKIFPESDKIFTFQQKDILEIKDSCIYVLDTNVLIVPYLTGKDSVNDFQRIFSALKVQKRLFIPERVSREFAKNRGQRIADTYNTISQSRDKLNSSQITLPKFPIFENNQDYVRLKEIESEINKLKEEFRLKLNVLSDHLMNWNWQDPVSTMYGKIFTADVIVPLEKKEDEIEKEHKFRNEHQIPPGFKKQDQEKIDGGIGDLINWLTVLQIGKAMEADVIFVTNEAHNDWFYRQQNTAILPRFELIDEFRRYTQGKTVHIIDFPKFLMTQEAAIKTVDEVSQISEPDLSITSSRYFTDHFSMDVTEALRSAVKGNRLHVLANNNLGGDPHIGAGKRLEVVYMYNGKSYRRIYNEHDEVILPDSSAY